jgi:cell wall-associated NlpC family hydrolase
MSELDKRLHAFRADLADIGLKGKVTAERFVRPQRMQVTIPVINIQQKPARDSMQVTQALWGDAVKVFDIAHGWAWVQLESDGYTGYCEFAHLGGTVFDVTHMVAVQSTVLYPKPDLKSQPVQLLSFQSSVAVNGVEGDYAILGTGGYVWAQHLRAADAPAPDFAGVAGMMLGVPYLWGGKSSAGLDCSGLVQIALQAAGKSCPRDTDMQEKELGEALPLGDRDNLKRGDLVFWAGHAGIMVSSTDLLHANGHHMMVMAEPLQEAMARSEAKGSAVTAIKRIQ